MTKDPFIEANKPRHKELEALRTLIAAKPEERHKALQAFLGTFKSTVATAPSKIEDPLEIYTSGDLRRIWLDSQSRPQHYTARQHDILDCIIRKLKPKRKPTAAERTDLLLTWMRPTISDAQRQARQRRSDKRHDEDDDIVLEDGTKLEEGTFQNQNYDKILI